jgi:indole-3-glycerol phosphate synthase
MDRKELNTALIQKKVLTNDKLQTLEKEAMQLKVPEPWEDFLVEKKALKEDELINIKAELLGISAVDLTNLQIAQDVLNLVPEPPPSGY